MLWFPTQHGPAPSPLPGPFFVLLSLVDAAQPHSVFSSSSSKTDQAHAAKALSIYLTAVENGFPGSSVDSPDGSHTKAGGSCRAGPSNPLQNFTISSD